MNLAGILERREKVEVFLRQHRIGLLTLVFTDMVGSTSLKQRLGDLAAFNLIQEHHALVRELLTQFAQAEEISTAGDSFLSSSPNLRMQPGSRCRCRRVCVRCPKRAEPLFPIELGFISGR